MGSSGKALEGHVSEIFTYLQLSCKSYFHRFPDSKAARNLIAPQPADFLFSCSSGVYLIECKESYEHETLREAWTDDPRTRRQVANHRQWLRSGQQSYYVFWNTEDIELQIHRGVDIIEANIKGRKLSHQWRPYYKIPWMRGIDYWMTLFKIDNNDS